MEIVSFLANLLLVLSPLIGIGQGPRNFCDEGQHQTQRPLKKPYIILVEGNVGCGKSTLLEYFSKSRFADDIDVVFEPVSKWQNIANSDLLDLQFRDPKRWDLAFNSYSALTRYQNDLTKTDKRARIMERSVYSGRYCFLENMRAVSGIADAEYLITVKWFEVLQKQLKELLKPDLILYIKCDVDVLIERIKKRGRQEEANIPRQFLEGLNKRHNDWLIHRNSTFPVPAPKVMVLNGNLPLKQFLDYLKGKEQDILDFMNL